MFAIGIVSSQAQVYSQNVVGYINQVIPVGYSMIANQVDYDGTGTNNTLANIMPSPPNYTHIYKFNGAGYDIANYYNGWNASGSSMTLNPGEGAFILNNSGSPITNTFVGTVLQGYLTNAVPAGYSIKGFSVPISGAISTTLKYPVGNFDHIYTWTGTNYAIYNYYNGWGVSGEPTINVGQSFFISRGASTNWVVHLFWDLLFGASQNTCTIPKIVDLGPTFLTGFRCRPLVCKMLAGMTPAKPSG